MSSLSSSSPAASWFARRTYRADDYDIRDLADCKAALGTSVSVVLPTRNEAGTVGRVVETVCGLADVLVDEVVVVDSASEDGTAEAAVAAGARVHQADQLLPHFGPCLGKGDALWRSLTVTGGDIVVFLDTDVTNPEVSFVAGLLGPLLSEPAVQLVKAFYDRPVKLDRVEYDSGGGRVTELTARPLINMFWPELAGLVQPLAGEYAGRRHLLEGLPFFTGYGVELGLLIDTVRVAGPDALAQVDLCRRVHRNQELPALSRMSFGILQAALQRLFQEGRAQLPPGFDDGLEYLQFERNDGDVDAAVAPIRLVERPPHASLS